jgi:DNA-binding beta-propeller fold protein YncE
MRRGITHVLGAVTVVAAFGFMSPASVVAATAAPAGARQAPPATIYVTVCSTITQCSSGKVTPFDTATNTAGKKITVGRPPDAIAITPNGATAYVATSQLGGSVTPIDTATNTAGPAIPTGSGPVAIAITPDGKTAYVVNSGSDTVTPIDTATNTAGPPIAMHPSFYGEPDEIAIAPDGATAYVATSGAPGTVTPISTATNTAGSAITMGAFVSDMVFTPDSKTVYVGNKRPRGVKHVINAVIPIDTATNTPGAVIPVGAAPRQMAITPNGATLYVTLDKATGSVVPISTATNTAGTPISAGNRPTMIAITPDGTKAYVASANHHNQTHYSILKAITIATGAVSRRIVVAKSDPSTNFLVAMAFTPSGTTLYTLGEADTGNLPGYLVAVSTATNMASRHFPVGRLPSAIAITP